MATLLPGEQLEIELSYNCNRNLGVVIFVEVFQSTTGASAAGSRAVQCTRKWVKTSVVVDGPFAVGPADVAVWERSRARWANATSATCRSCPAERTRKLLTPEEGNPSGGCAERVANALRRRNACNPPISSG
jgi:hypothetical protein